MNWIEKQQYKVILPSIVVSELLVAVPTEDHVSVLSQLAGDYRIVPFDLVCARKFAEMRRSHIIKNRLIDLLNPDKLSATRAALKADAMIIATAIAYGAEILFSHNDDMRKMAEGFIEALGFDDVQFQRSLNLPEDESED